MYFYIFAVQNKERMRIAVFCSANDKIDPFFFDCTHELGKYIASHHHDLVYGGCNMGLMECIAKSVKENGGHTIGVVPSMIEECGKISAYVDECIKVNNLSDRKDKILELSDVLIALPGGIGTLDEIFTVAASATIGYHCKKVILYNIGGYWDKIIDILQDMEENHFIRGNVHNYILSCRSLQEMDSLLG